MPTIRLYSNPISGHAHRVALYLSLLDLPHEIVNVDLKSREHKTDEFLDKNAFGQVPVLEDGDNTIADSNAILVYLGEIYDTEGVFWPMSAVKRAEVVRWLSVAAGQLAYGPGAARRSKILGAKIDYDAAVELTKHLFGILEARLVKEPFLVGHSPTLADLALYAYVARAPEGEVSLEPYPHIRSWLGRLEELPRFVPMMSVKKG